MPGCMKGGKRRRRKKSRKSRKGKRKQRGGSFVAVLKEALVPTIKTLPSGSMNTKVVISEGEIVERVYKTPKGEIISLFPNDFSEAAA